MNGTRKISLGKVTQSKVRGKALADMLDKEMNELPSQEALEEKTFESYDKPKEK